MNILISVLVSLAVVGGSMLLPNKYDGDNSENLGATSFPTSLDTLVNPTATDRTSVVSHSSQHTNANDAIEALQAKVGADGSAVTTSFDYKLSDVTSTAKAVSTAGDQSVSGTKTFTGSVVTGSGILSATNPKITSNIYDTDGLSILGFNASSSAVNAILMGNAKTGYAPFLTATGTDSDTHIDIYGKGTGKVRIGDARLEFPDTDGANGEVLTTNGNGTLSFSTAVDTSNKVAVNFLRGTYNGTTNEQTIASTTISGGVLGTSNGIVYKVFVSNLDTDKGDASNQTVTVRAKYGSTTVASIVLGNSSLVDDYRGEITFQLFASSSVSAQRGFLYTSLFTANGTLGATDAGNNFATGTSTIDSSLATTTAITVQWSDASTNLGITTEGFTVTRIR